MLDVPSSFGFGYRLSIADLTCGLRAEEDAEDVIAAEAAEEAGIAADEDCTVSEVLIRVDVALALGVVRLVLFLRFLFLLRVPAPGFLPSLQRTRTKSIMNVDLV